MKASAESREKILAAARNARRSSLFPSGDLNDINSYYTKENGIDEFKQQLHNLINKNDHIIINGG